MEKNEFGVFSIILSKGTIPHNTKVKISLVIPTSVERLERIPAYIKR
jgi:1,4-alpha-glucan branching enzyme